MSCFNGEGMAGPNPAGLSPLSVTSLTAPGATDMPKTNVKAGTWISDLRAVVKRDCGQGWKVQEQSGNLRIFCTLEDGSRPSATTDIEWKKSNSTAILNRTTALAQMIREDDTLTLRAANDKIQLVGVTVTGNGLVAGAINWKQIAADFLRTRADRRATTLRDTTNRVNNAVALFDQKPKPQGGADLMKLYAKTYFANCPAGGNGRKRHLGDVAAFLSYAVDKAGAPGRWQPLTGADRDALIGTADDNTEELTPPVKPEQLAALLDALAADIKPELRLAVALVGCFGLRPAELAALVVEDGKLYVKSNVKRNARSMKKDISRRLVVALEIPGRNDGAKALNLYASGLVKLPKAIRTAIDSGEFKKVGDAFRQLLDRYPFWTSMVAATPGLTPYSLRHGWAWRAHKTYDRSLSIRDAAALLGHTPTTHMKHYGRWTDEQGLLDAVAALTATTPLPHVAVVE